MEQQLDGPAASLLERALRDLRIGVRTSARTEAIAGDGRAEAVVLADGEEIEADLVVVAAGVRPDADLARTAGIEVGRGVLVDDELRTSAAGVRAVGECAEHRGNVYGLWAPLLEQSRTLGASLAGRPAAFHGAAPATTLKVAGIELFCCGRVAAADGDDEVLALDSRRGRYRRLLVDGGRPPRGRDPPRRPARRPRAARAAAQRRGGAAGAARRAGGGAVIRSRRRRPVGHRLLLPGRDARRDRPRDPRPRADDRRARGRAHPGVDRLRRLPAGGRGAARGARV